MRICAFGDSFVAGTGDGAGLGWVGRWGNELCIQDPDITLYNLGIRGDTSVMVQTRWRAEFEARRKPGVPERLVFSFGVNDCCDNDQGTGQRVTLPETLAAAESIWVEAKSLAPAIMIGPVPIARDAVVNDRALLLDQSFAEGAKGLDMPYVQLFADLLASEVWMAEVSSWDGAHPSARGYQLLYEHLSAEPVWQAWTSI